MRALYTDARRRRCDPRRSAHANVATVRASRCFSPLQVVARLTLLGGLGIGAGACQVGAAGPPAVPETGAAASAAGLDTTEEDRRFAESTHRLLENGGRSPERGALLSRVIATQLSHARELFERGEEVRGAQAVVGAFSLARAGDPTSLRADRDLLAALDGAIRRFSARGDEGRALGLLQVKRAFVTKGGSEEREVAQHIDALERWHADTRGASPMQDLAAEQRQAVARALLEPSDERLATAALAVSRWIERAIAINVAFQETRQLPDREEAVEAFRALQSGAYVMAALYLRHGRFAEALQAIETTTASRVVRPNFFARLRAAAEGARAEDMRQLAREFTELGRDPEAEEGPLDADVLGSALWGVGLEAYRLDASSLAVAHLLANQLVLFELPEVAPLVLGKALGLAPAPASLNGALEVVAGALAKEETSPSIATARRIFAASRQLLEVADRPEYAGELRTSAASVRRQMGTLELRAGHAEVARELMVTALRAEPTVWGLVSLATLQRQLGDEASARATAERAYSLAPRGVPDLDAAQARWLVFELERDSGNEPAAGRALDDALAVALDARRLGGNSPLALRAELLLSRTLDGYGERERAARSMSRALDLADTHRSLLPHTMLAAVGRAVALRDVPGARSAVALGLKADTDHDSLVYGALWLGLLERLENETSDGKVDRILAEAVNGDGWTNKLARWFRGGLGDADLVRAARSRSESVEAEFYTAMRAWAQRAPDGLDRVRRVAHDTQIDLYEVRLARDLIAPRLRLPLPPKVTLP